MTCFAFKDALLNTSTCCVRWLFDLLLPSLKQTDQSPVTHRLSASVCHTHTEMRTEGTGTAPLSCLLATNPYLYKDIHKMLNLTLQSFHTANQKYCERQNLNTLDTRSRNYEVHMCSLVNPVHFCIAKHQCFVFACSFLKKALYCSLTSQECQSHQRLKIFKKAPSTVYFFNALNGSDPSKHKQASSIGIKSYFQQQFSI